MNRSRRRTKKNSKLPIILGVIVGVILIIALGSGSEDPVEVSTEPTATPEPIVEATPEAIPEQGSSAKVDYILRQAKADAESPDGEAKAEAAYAWIVETVPEWYDGPEIMEQAIYNGALVEYYYTGKNNVRAEVGMDTVQAVKYVYRGVETVLDDATQENIRQIREGIAEDQG